MATEAKRTLDVICLGRAAVDLYGEQVGGRLEDMHSFRKYLGGSSANLAAGLARLGLRSAMLTRVGDEQMGRFVREALRKEGVDVSQVRTDPDRLTGLVILGIGAAGGIPHIFYRERCADMGMVEADVDPAFIASARMVSITGTHLSTPSTRAAVVRAMRHARESGTLVTLDIDYRPVLWGLVAAGEGADRYVASSKVSTVLAGVLPLCDLVVGTEEEIRIAGGAEGLLAALQGIRAQCEATIVLKRGAAGCTVFSPGPILSLDTGTVVAGRPVEVFNTVGAGDAFLSGFLAGWLAGDPPARCGELGNACGALVVARHGCTPAIPSRIELDSFLGRTPPPRAPRLDDQLAHLHRVTTWTDDARPLCVLAFDHRKQMEDLANASDQPLARIADFKRLVAQAVLEVAHSGPGDVRPGVIVDDRYGQPARDVLADAGLWCGRPVELPGSRPLEFEAKAGIGLHVNTWPSGDTVKCLLFYHPDDRMELRLAQEAQVGSLYRDLCVLERRLLLEVICTASGLPVDAQTLPRVLQRFYNLGVRPDWWKLEPQDAAGWEAVSAVIESADPHCKGIVLLGLDAPEERLREGFAAAAGARRVRGFAVGRSIFGDPARAWFAGELDDADVVADVAARYRRLIGLWREATGISSS